MSSRPPLGLLLLARVATAARIHTGTGVRRAAPQRACAMEPR
ncbi:hypothetical protein [Streptomyces lincolnensis]|nr:hypothetical protein [Streptomyces lincolnensis]